MGSAPPPPPPEAPLLPPPPLVQTLNGSVTLELVNEKYWKLSKPLELYYAPTKEQN